MRLLVGVLVLGLAGCLQAGEPSEAPNVAPIEEPPILPAAGPDANATPLPPPAFTEVGASWSRCAYRSNALVHRHEWAADLIPPEYRQTNTVAANFGQSTLKFLACGGVAVGNDTFRPEVHLGYFGVMVAPPEEMVAPWPSFYLLDLLTDDEVLAAQMGDAGIPVRMASFGLDEDSFSVQQEPLEEEGFDALVSELRAEPVTGDSTEQTRLHWRTPDGLHCWMDLEKVYSKTHATDLRLEGRRGHPAQVAGPAGSIVGVGSRGAEDGRMAPPSCLEAPA